ncbi:MAG: GCN5-related N-acetyltransferase [Marmoricola sp.]|nr:GCN5-related N-acetyltransferase [Marmoricola sp.]
MAAESTPDLVRLAELSEARCLEARYAAAGDETREALGIAHTRIGGAVVGVLGQEPTGRWNQVVGLGIEEALTAEMLDEVIEFAHGAEGLVLRLAPGADPEGLLAHRGLTHQGASARFLAPGGFIAEAETGLHLEQITPDLGRHVARVVGEALGLPEDSPLARWYAEGLRAPGTTAYAAFDGWTIVAVASLFVDGDRAVLSGAATLPGERGRGAHSGLVARRIFDANALGVRWTIAAAGTRPDPALRNLRRLGLPESYERQNWLWRP